MKIQWSVFYSLFFLLALAGCGSEEFGTSPQSSQSKPDALKNYSHSSCSTYTLIKPKVDVLYVIDNSSSSYYIPDSIKTDIARTVDKLSSDFDYRVISTPLLATSDNTSTANNDYQVLSNTPELMGHPKLINSASEFNFKRPPVAGMEQGLSRITSFVNTHKNNLLRNNAYLIIVLVSNGRDLLIEEDKGFNNGETRFNEAAYLTQLASFRSLKSQLSSIQLRLISVTAKSVCQSGYRTARDSYVKMSKQLYEDSGATDNESTKDSFDLCGSGVQSIFASINNSIKQVVLPHQYGLWPVTFTSDPIVSLDDIKVHKVKPNGTSTELAKNSDWFLEAGGTKNTRVGPMPVPGVGEQVTAPNFVRFATPIVYPDCVLVTSRSKTEYFDYIVLPQKPRLETVKVTINGQVVPRSTTNGWSDETSAQQTINIKAPYPNAGDDQPPVMRTGFMLKLNGRYYKTGDSVQADYIPAGI